MVNGPCLRRREARPRSAARRAAAGPHRRPADLRPRPLRCRDRAEDRGALDALAAAVAADPSAALSAIPILMEDEEQCQLVEWNATATDGGGVAVHDLLRAQWRLRAQATAVTAGGRAVAWADVDRLADGIAGRLLACGVKPAMLSPSVQSPRRARRWSARSTTCCSIPRSRPSDWRSCSAIAERRPSFCSPGSPAGGHPADAAARPSRGRSAASAFPDVAPDAVCCVQYTPSANGEGCAIPMLHGAVATSTARRRERGTTLPGEPRPYRPGLRPRSAARAPARLALRCGVRRGPVRAGGAPTGLASGPAGRRTGICSWRASHRARVSEHANRRHVRIDPNCRAGRSRVSPSVS